MPIALGAGIGIPLLQRPLIAGPEPDPDGLVLLRTAALWLDAASETNKLEQFALNRATVKTVPDARYGSVGHAEIRDDYLILPGVANNYASTPDAAVLDITGDMEYIVRVALNDYSNGSFQTLLQKSNDNGQPWLAVDTVGRLRFDFHDSTPLQRSFASAVASPFVDGTTYWIRAVLDVSNGSGGSTVTFYYAADSVTFPSSWTTYDTITIGTTSGAQQPVNTYPVQIGAGAAGAAYMAAGKFYRAIIKNGIDGTTVFDADFGAATPFATSFTESSSNAATVTINKGTGVDTNDPTLLVHDGVSNYLYTPGILGNNARAVDIAAYDITDDLEIIVRISVSTITTSGEIVAKWGLSGSWAYTLRMESGNLVLYNSSTASSLTGTISRAHGLAVGDKVWVRATRIRSTGVLALYKAADSVTIPSSWTQLGADGAGDTLALAVNAVPLSLGQDSANALPFTGGIYRAIVRNGIGGTTVFDADFTSVTNHSSFTESSSNAATVTINRATSGKKSCLVTRNVWLFGTDDYLEVPDNPLLDLTLADSFSLVAIVRQHATPLSFGTFVGKKTASGDGFYLGNNGTTNAIFFSIDEAANAPNVISSTATISTLVMFTGVRNISSDNLIAYLNTTASAPTADTTTATIANALSLMIGRSPDASPLYIDSEFIAVALFKFALTSGDIADIMSYYGVS